MTSTNCARISHLLLGLVLSLSLSVAVRADDPDAVPPRIADATAGAQSFPGFSNFWWKASEGKVLLEIARFDREFLYVHYLSRGLGSNDVGLDRGQIGDSYLVYFRRVGPKVLMMQRNYAYRAESNDPAERRAVDESFAQSTLWGFDVIAEEDGRVLVDATGFLLRDAHDVAGSLRRSKQGSFRLESSRCAIDLERTKNFRKNTEFEAILTFMSDSAGSWVRQVAPTPTAFAVQAHHSFVELPDSGFTPRGYDVRSGYFDIEYMDFAAPLSEPIRKRFIVRHRLNKKDPSAKLSEPVEPIVYYVDPGAPEPIRSALVEGASWWYQAFEAAGYRDAFRVEVLPDSADPLDVRYNVIQWVHRSSRGWSYGGSLIDPRTGEILKGHVTLGSLRARQDYLIAEGLLQPYESGSDSISPRIQELALARIRQLSAHEVGHTLGLRHNYCASTVDRASVMDYPYPFVQIDSAGEVDLSQAYTTGIGTWDRATIMYGYSDYPAATDVDGALAVLLDSVFASGQRYLSDADARPEGSASPCAHLWDNGANAVDELVRLLDVRAMLLQNFSDRAIQNGTPLVMLEEALVPIYLFHRYQIEACAKSLGGIDYAFAVRGSGPQTVSPVAADEQWRALKALLLCLEPSALAIPESLFKLMPPQTTHLPRAREIFERRTGSAFDPLAAAENVADLVVRMTLNSDRAARLVEQTAQAGSLPGLDEVIDRLLSSTWKRERAAGLDAEIQRSVDNIALHYLIRLAAGADALPQARALATRQLENLGRWCEARTDRTSDTGQQAHLMAAARTIAQFLENPSDFEFDRILDAPAGSPIGTGQPGQGCDW